MQNKKCTKCGIEYPATSEFFHSNGQKGLKACCKKCRNEKQKLFYRNNFEYYQSYSRKYQIEHKEQAREYGKIYRSKNKERIRETSRKRKREYFRNRLKTDPAFKLRLYMSNRLYCTMSGRSKNSATFTYIGCTPSELRQYLESKFLDGMSWENYGNPSGDHSSGWHIDHIIPLSSFDFSVEENIYVAWHYSNLRPLWGLDNLRKSNRII